jgi:two-component sensor histidine kinase
MDDEKAGAELRPAQRDECRDRMDDGVHLRRLLFASRQYAGSALNESGPSTVALDAELAPFVRPSSSLRFHSKSSLRFHSYSTQWPRRTHEDHNIQPRPDRLLERKDAHAALRASAQNLPMSRHGDKRRHPRLRRAERLHPGLQGLIGDHAGQMTGGAWPKFHAATASDLTRPEAPDFRHDMWLQALLKREWVRRLLLRPMPLWRGQAVAVLCVLAAALIRLAFAGMLGDGLPFVTFFPAVVFASALGGPLAGFSALALSTVVVAAFVVRPVNDLAPGELLRAIAFWVLCSLLIFLVSLMRELAQTIAVSEERAHLIARETAHRARNVLGLVQAIARQTSRRTDSVSDFLTRFDERLAALARAQDVLGSAQADLKPFLERVIEPFARDRFDLIGSPTAVPEEHGVALALVVHELATNALKYGALSTPAGRVAISWQADRDVLRLLWRETSGPPVIAPSNQGSGSRLFASAFPPDRGEVTVDYAPQGVVCRIAVPVDRGKE